MDFRGGRGNRGSGGVRLLKEMNGTRARRSSDSIGISNCEAEL